MKTVSTSALRKNIAKVLRTVLDKKTPVHVTRYGRVVATITPTDEKVSKIQKMLRCSVMRRLRVIEGEAARRNLEDVIRPPEGRSL